MERKGCRLAFLGYSTSVNQPQGFAAHINKPGIAALRISPLYSPPQVNEEDLEMMMEDIKGARPRADLIIVSLHWSVGYMGGSHTLAMHQPAITRAAIDAGADLVLGHGPHLLQGIEVYRGKSIFYNLGNFVVDRDTPIKDSILLDCIISEKKIQKVSFVPVLINEKGQPQPLSSGDENCTKIQQLMEKLSRRLGTTLSFEGNEGVVKV